MMRQRARILFTPTLVVACLLVATAGTFPQTGDDQVTVIHLFSSPTCPDCQAVKSYLSEVLPRHPEFRLREYNISDPHNIEIMADFYDRYGVPEEDWGGTLALFVGDRWWNDQDKIVAEFEDALDEIRSASAPEEIKPSGQQRLVKVFERFGIATVALAGLVDGINPCALAALIFLISFLSFARRGPREILATGLLFAGGVFAAYFAVGLGMFQGLQELSGFALASKLLYPVMATGTVVLTVLSLRDYLLARADRTREMTLKLPRKLLGLSHATIRRLIGSPWFLALAFVAGMTVSMLELLCTGQVYLPTLMYIASTDELRGQALALLVVYVALFTLPIVALTLASYWGVSSQRIVEWGKQHTAASKLALTVVFALLTLYLAAFSVHVWLGQ
jgi:thiol-disulfide isomerase/thioredoxin